MRTLAVLLHLATAPLLLAASPRVVFERVLPAAHTIHGEEVAIAQAIGDAASIETFIDVFVAQVNKSQILRMRDSRRATGPADAYLNVKAFTCTTATRERNKNYWVDALCTANVDVLSNTMQRLSTFHVEGAGTSGHLPEIGEEQKDAALQQAARYAAISAAERITPRRVRESIALETNAPAFEEGLAMIESGRLAEARAIWVEALRKNASSAPLRFNLGAVCEALGDRRAAEQHYRAARELAPNEARYALELKLFGKRD
ncbi:MAG TPA: hypothetical protein VJZ00_08585 [Thermoanaerobaculia bacterium]|nr:hypothetical protein [Thermoanaerobaculia bacterium]